MKSSFLSYKLRTVFVWYFQQTFNTSLCANMFDNFDSSINQYYLDWGVYVLSLFSTQWLGAISCDFDWGWIGNLRPTTAWWVRVETYSAKVDHRIIWVSWDGYSLSYFVNCPSVSSFESSSFIQLRELCMLELYFWRFKVVGILIVMIFGR